MQKILTLFLQKNNSVFVIFTLNFNETLTNDVVNFEQPAPDLQDQTQLYSFALAFEEYIYE